ncbi:Caspase domain [Sesbania bispinosa]|nr:Caspase domain [Sesbania bispinosa]
MNIISHPNEDNADLSMELQSITSSIIPPSAKDGGDKTVINNPGNVSGNGNGSIYVNIYKVNVNYPGCGRPVQSYYPQLRPPPPLRLPSAHGSKRAVLFGISYANTGAPRLKGSVYNAHSMKYFLINQLGFPTDSICMLTGPADDSEEEDRIPTKQNMRMAMRWLVEGCQAGDSLVFYFCGHGSRVKDLNRDEVDGCDEALCPVDYEHEGKIVDDEINATIVRPLPQGAKLHALVDASFSGTILDLPFVYRPMNWIGSTGWKDHRHRRGSYKGTRGGLAVCISACDDDGNAADKPALTYTFLQAMRDLPKLTYGRLLNAMRSTINWDKAGKFGLYGQVYARGTWQHYAHEPQLSSSEKFDIYSKSILM